MDKLDELMFEFLNTSYPLGRIKEKNRFKKGICINGQNFFLPKDKVAIIATLYNILETVYAPSPEKIGYIIEKQYKLKLK